MHPEGVEPSHLPALEPKSSVSAISPRARKQQADGPFIWIRRPAIKGNHPSLLGFSSRSLGGGSVVLDLFHANPLEKHHLRRIAPAGVQLEDASVAAVTAIKRRNDLVEELLDGLWLRKVRCHEAAPEQKEKFHYALVKEYPGGGREVRKIIDQPALPAKPAWEEFEQILRYIPYTPAELALATDRAADTDAMLLDHELRLALLELGGSL